MLYLLDHTDGGLRRDIARAHFLSLFAITNWYGAISKELFSVPSKSVSKSAIFLQSYSILKESLKALLVTKTGKFQLVNCYVIVARDNN